MDIHEQRVDTPTVIDLRQALVTMRPPQAYIFVLMEGDLVRLRDARVPPQAYVALALIKGAVRAAGSAEWITIKQRAYQSLGRDRRFWYEATQRLEAAGMIQVQRHRGRKPRYRLV